MKTLHPEVAAKYQLIGIRPGKYNFKNFGEIDLCTLSVNKADALVARGFLHLKLRSGASQPAGDQTVPSLKARPIGKAAAVANEPAKDQPVIDLRKNKQYVNKLLTMDWKDLSHQEHLVFFNDQAYFLEKKKILLDISAADRDMKSLHAKLKSLKDAEKRKEIMQQLSALEDGKVQGWSKIDTWNDPMQADPAKIADEAARKAIEKDKLIKAHGNYIYRAELALPNMPEKTASEKKHKAEKQAEVNRRKQELIDIGSPYDRKSRN